jgi:hypothetical protein
MQVTEYIVSLESDKKNDHQQLASDSSTPDYSLVLSCQLLLDLPELGVITLKSVYRLFLELSSRNIVLE